MSNKATCPACHSHTSAIWRAWQEGDPCPTCGLPAEAAAAVDEARKRGADEQLVDMTAKAEQRAAVAERQVEHLTSLLDQIAELAGERSRQPDPEPGTFSDMAPGWRL